MAEIKDVDVEVLGTGPIYIHMSKSNPLSNKEEIHFKELINSTYMRLPSDFFSDLNRSIVIDNIQLANFPNILIMSNYHALLNIAKNTNSFLVGHKWQKEELKHSKIASIPLTNCDIKKHFVIIRHKNELISRDGSIFLDIIYDTYKDM